MSLRLRLAFFGVGLVALALLVFGVVLYALFARGVLTNQDDALRARAHAAAGSMTSPPAARSPVAPVDLGKEGDIFIEVISDDGSVLYSTGILDGSPPLAPQSLLGQAQTRHGTFGNVGPLRVYLLPIPSGYVLAGQSTRVPQNNLSGVLAFLVISAIAGLVAALIAIWVVAGLALAPLKNVAVAAEEIGRTRDFARRLPIRRTRDEVALLASSFNGMLVRLQDAFESQRRFVSDASHELRTPLTTIQGNAGLLASRSVTEDVRRAAAHSLSQIGPEAKVALPAVVAALKDDDKYVRTLLIRVLGNLGPGGRVDASSGQPHRHEEPGTDDSNVPGSATCSRPRPCSSMT